MKLICLVCGNHTYFELDVETLKEILVSKGDLILNNAVFSEFDYTEEILRRNLDKQVVAILEQPSSGLIFDPQTETYYSGLKIHCAQCGSNKVHIPSRRRSSLSLDEELRANLQEYQNIRKARCDHDNKLPVLWQP